MLELNPAVSERTNRNRGFSREDPAVMRAGHADEHGGRRIEETKLDEDNMRQAERCIHDISISPRTSRLDKRSVAY
jgi:hypothetical protein